MSHPTDSNNGSVGDMDQDEIADSVSPVLAQRIHITPKKRALAQSSAPSSAKGKADLLDPNHGLCFLTLQNTPGAVEYCHIVPQATKGQMVCDLNQRSLKPPLTYICAQAHPARICMGDEIW